MEQSELVETLKSLQVTIKDLEIFRDYFSIIHHTRGRIRLRASLKLKEVAQNNSINPKALLETLERIPCIASIKFNPLVGSVTIHYDASILRPSLWESCIKGESLDEVAEIINKSLKEIV